MSRCNESAAGTSYQIDLCALQDFAARWSAIWFDLCSRETEMRVTVARKHRKHRKQCQWRSVEISGDTAQLRHVACCVCCDSLNLVTRSLDNSDWRIRDQKWPVWDAFGRIWTHLVWKEQSEDHSVSSVWDWDCASVVWFARRDCWHLLTGTVSQCNSVTVLHLSSCASIPLRRQHSWQQHRPWLMRRLRCGQSQY